VSFLSSDITEQATVKGHFRGVVIRSATGAFFGYLASVFSKEHHSSTKNCLVGAVEIPFHKQNGAELVD
jgi:hypothetical protein